MADTASSGTYSYVNPLFQRNDGDRHQEPKRDNHYATNLLSEKATGFIDDAMKDPDRPFFLMVATVAPHTTGDTGRDDEGEDSDSGSSSEVPDDSGPSPQHAPIPAPKYEGKFLDARVPRNPNFNPTQKSGASWVRKLNHKSEEVEKKWDQFHIRRIQALGSVDDLVGDVVKSLTDHGVIGNTYIIYSTDNGFHIGQHNLQPGKRCPYEESINIPLIIRGPGIQPRKSYDMSSHVDLVPTILDWAGVPLPPDLDGQKLITVDQAEGQGKRGLQEHTQVEHWGIGARPSRDNVYKHTFSTYKAIRVWGEGYNLYYAIWCNDEHELYDMREDKDPWQLNNLLLRKKRGGGADGESEGEGDGEESTTDSSSTTTTDDSSPENTATFDFGPDGRQVSKAQLTTRLDTLLRVLKDCAGDSCRNPWGALHPKGGVTTLKDALKEEYDDFYKGQKRVEFQECTPSYIPEKEGGKEFDRDEL